MLLPPAKQSSNATGNNLIESLNVYFILFEAPAPLPPAEQGEAHYSI